MEEEELSKEEKYEKVLKLAELLRSSFSPLWEYSSVEAYNNAIESLSRFIEIPVSQQLEKAYSYTNIYQSRDTLIETVKNALREYKILVFDLTNDPHLISVNLGVEFFATLDQIKKFYRAIFIIYTELAEIKEFTQFINSIIGTLNEKYKKDFYNADEVIDRVRQAVLEARKKVIQKIQLISKFRIYE
jgi:hypothetical protein